MNAAYKFRVYPNEEQRTMIAKTIGCCRFVYHHMLADKIAYYEEQKAWAGVCFAAEGYPSVYAGVSVDRHFCGNAGFLVSKYSGKAGLDSFPSVLSHLHGVKKCLLRDTSGSPIYYLCTVGGIAALFAGVQRLFRREMGKEG